MKRLQKAAITLTVLMILSSLGCSNQALQRVKNASSNMKNAASMEATLAFSLSMNTQQGSGATPYTAATNAKITYFKSPMTVKILATSNVSGQVEKNTEAYVELTSSNVLNIYVKNGEKWQKQSISLSSFMASTPNAQAKSFDLTSAFKSVKVAASEEINGIKTDRIDCVVDEQKLVSALQSSTSNPSLAQYAQILQMIQGAFKDLTVQYWIAQNEDRIVQMRIDLTKAVQTLLTSVGANLTGAFTGLGGTGVQTPSTASVSVSECSVQITFDKINNATPFTIPDEARTAVAFK